MQCGVASLAMICEDRVDYQGALYLSRYKKNEASPLPLPAGRNRRKEFYSFIAPADTL